MPFLASARPILLLIFLLLPAASLRAEILITASGAETDSSRIQAALDTLDPTRETTQTLRLVGAFSLEEPLVLPSLIHLDLREARLSPARPLPALLTNADLVGGNHHITISGGFLDGRGLTSADSPLNHGIELVRVRDLSIDNVKVENFSGDGILLSGRGQRTYRSRVTGVRVSDNGRMGLNIMWAMRHVSVSDVVATGNGEIGVRSDHSEGQYVNIIADGNRGDGIFIRNVFGNAYSNLTATRNGRAGIHVRGLVDSVGANWIVHNNSQAARGKFSDLFFSSRADLSYGNTRSSVITGINVGGYTEYGPIAARHAIEFQGTEPRQSYPGLVLSGVTLTGGPLAGPVSAGGEALLRN